MQIAPVHQNGCANQKICLDTAGFKMASSGVDDMAAPLRISVRLNGDQSESLDRLCRETGSDVSQVVRQALDAFLVPKSGPESSSSPPKRLSPPEEIIPLTTAYLAWAGGDARTELRKFFVQLLTVSFALKGLYPRTKGIKEVYDALLPLYGLSEWFRV